jgi:hypothetical protein
MMPRCDVCGDDGTFRPLQVTYGKSGDVTCYCSLCEGLVKAGLLRPELVDGKLRFRKWHMGEWTPGELLPAPETRH